MKFYFLVLSIFLTSVIHAQEKPYHPEANAKADIAKAIAQAKKEKKHVLLMAGGNWCGWCLKFNKFAKDDFQIDSTIKQHFVVYHLNFSKENENLPVFQSLEYPQRFGFPVFIILDGKGKRIHTQQSDFLEKGMGYDKEKVLLFLEMWSPKALNPALYQKQKV